MVLKLSLKGIWINIALLTIFSWANMASGWDHFRREEIPAVEPHLRLISMDIPQTLTSTEDVKSWANIKYDSGMKPEILRACFNFSGIGESCVDVEEKNVTSRNFQVLIHVPMGTKKIDCYAEYIRDRKISLTNTITYYLITLKNNHGKSEGVTK